jgi:hypothetical protein
MKWLIPVLEPLDSSSPAPAASPEPPPAPRPVTLVPAVPVPPTPAERSHPTRRHRPTQAGKDRSVRASGRRFAGAARPPDFEQAPIQGRRRTRLTASSQVTCLSALAPLRPAAATRKGSVTAWRCLNDDPDDGGCRKLTERRPGLDPFRDTRRKESRMDTMTETPRGAPRAIP